MFPGRSGRIGWQCWGELRLFFYQLDESTIPWNSNTWICWQHLGMLGLCLTNPPDQPCHVSRREITWSYLTKSLWLLRHRRCQEVLLSKISRWPKRRLPLSQNKNFTVLNSGEVFQLVFKNIKALFNTRMKNSWEIFEVFLGAESDPKLICSLKT